MASVTAILPTTTHHLYTMSSLSHACKRREIKAGANAKRRVAIALPGRHVSLRKKLLRSLVALPRNYSNCRIREN